ncbi:MAG: hypothetical protein M3Z03_06550, partial [Actinomycetota bacterium]|nr:hypothetical protein [Actinomycetota bacterium]
GDAVSIDLRYDAVMEPHVVMADREAGHFDQLGRLTGTITLSGDTVEVGDLAIRDRSWYVRDDRRSLRAGYTYGAAGDDHHFLVFTQPSGAEDTGPVVGGYLLRDGQKAAITSGTRTIASRRRGHPDEVAIDAVDELGRSLAVTGRVAASMASQSTPAMFSWMSIVDWSIDGATGHGEDHDVWSPDLLARPAR